MEQEIKPGDFVRLTDPLDNGTIVRIENVDEHGFASWLGGSQNCDMEQIEIKVEEEGNPFTDDLREYTVTLSDRVQEIESDFGVKLYPESAVQHYKHIADVEAKEHEDWERAFNKEHNKLIEEEDVSERWQTEYIKEKQSKTQFVAKCKKLAKKCNKLSTELDRATTVNIIDNLKILPL